MTQQQTQPVLVINCGSSSIKFSVIDPVSRQALLSGLAERLRQADASIKLADGRQAIKIGQSGHQAAIEIITKILAEENFEKDSFLAIGHRVVHGGEQFIESVQIDHAVIEAIQANEPLAPLHNPANLIGIEATRKVFMETPQIAVFDTAFHQSMPKHAYLYPLPYDWYSQYGVRRYGFHGTSHRFVIQQAIKQLDIPYQQSALISVHLGNGCSATAVLDGKSVDTTMGMTPLEGLVMGTRCGDIDPAIVGFICKQLSLSVEQVNDILNQQSGLLGISGKSNDMRTIEKLSNENDPRAQIALEIFCYRLAKSIASLVVPLGRLDALIFTGGIGENSSLIRMKVLQQLHFLGFVMNNDANNIHGKQTEGRITKGSPHALVIATDEELMIALDCQKILRDKK